MRKTWMSFALPLHRGTCMIFGFSRNAGCISPNEFRLFWIQDIPELTGFTKTVWFHANPLKITLWQTKIKPTIVRFRAKEYALNTLTDIWNDFGSFLRVIVINAIDSLSGFPLFVAFLMPCIRLSNTSNFKPPLFCLSMYRYYTRKTNSLQ